MNELKLIGFREVVDMGPEDINKRFFDRRADGLRVGQAGRLMAAWY